MRLPRLALRTALAGIVLLGVLSTALLIHLSWAHTARQNVADVAGQLNKQIVDSIRGEVSTALANAQAAEESVRSIFFQAAITPDDEGKREFIFTALLNSQPVLSWISFGWPNGHFFGTERFSEVELRNVEVMWEADHPKAALRVDQYLQAVPEARFLGRSWERSTFSSTDQPWYKAAIAADHTVWTLGHNFPDGSRPAVTISARFDLYKQFIGVIAVSIELRQLSQYMAGLHVGTSGTAVILDSRGGIIASPDPAELKAENDGVMRDISQLSLTDSPLLVTAREAIAANHVNLAKVSMAEPLPPFRAADGSLYFVSLSSLQFLDWAIVTVIPEKDFLGNIDRNTQRLVYALIVFTLVMLLAAILLADRLIGRPLIRIAGQLHHIEEFRLDQIQHVPSSLKELDNLSSALIQMAQGLTSFKKYLPTELVRTLVSQGIEARPGGEQQTLTVFFSDLAGFTTLSERLGPGIVPVLTEYLSAASHAIHQQGGTIDKFIGDAVMAFWGAPVRKPEHAIAACRAALACQRLMSGLLTPQDVGETQPLRLRIGINTGPMLVGNIGSEERLNYTVIGDTVNLASRLEAINKVYGTDIIVGEATRRAAGHAIVARELDQVAVYGRVGSTAIFELLGMSDEGAAGAQADWIAAYEAGLAAYRARRWDEAIAAFETCRKTRPGGDRPSELMIDQCRALMANPPPADWAAVNVMGTK
ncbi:MAG TPA: adenylate/guanylate cyclase domain-containing protein [Candidatus Polarisedimenticolia bacterium]|nr:adenylate/guanylate cyclase domain-containing protein [Candidatus Polarisedimenticolia bacterium]